MKLHDILFLTYSTNRDDDIAGSGELKPRLNVYEQQNEFKTDLGVSYDATNESIDFKSNGSDPPDLAVDTL